MPSYKVLTGLSYPPDKEANVGDVVTDIPAKSVKWLLEQEHIEEAGNKPASAAPTPAPAPEPVEDEE